MMLHHQIICIWNIIFVKMILTFTKNDTQFQIETDGSKTKISIDDMWVDLIPYL